MVVKVSKPEINVREKISELDKPSGIAGQAMLVAETVAEQQVLIGLSNRNLILNGDFQVFQRGTSSTSAGYQTVDRWRNAHGGLGAATQSHTEDGPSFAGHRNSYKILSTAATGSVPAGADPWVKYEVESRDIECLNLHLWKKELTLSFWIKTNKPGQHSISLNSGNFSSNVFTVPYNISGTEWQKVTVTFPPPPANLPSGSVGLRLYWSLGAGSTYQQALSDTNRWVSAGKYEVVGNTRIAGVNGAFIQIAGVQLELGKVATPFEHRSYAEELALCQRYYKNYYFASQVQIYNESSNADHKWLYMHFPEMRAAPGLDGTVNMIGSTNGTLGTVSTIVKQGGSSAAMSCRVTFNQTGGNSNAIYHVDGFANGYAKLNAEL